MVQWLRLCSQSRGPGSIPCQGSRSHLPQLRVHMPQLQIPQAGIKRILHATTKIEGLACHSWGPVQANKYIFKKKKTRRKKERCQVWISKMWGLILANTESEKESTHREAVRIHCDKYQLSSPEYRDWCHQSINTSVPMSGHTHFPAIFQDLEIQVINVISFTSVQMKVTKKIRFQIRRV